LLLALAAAITDLQSRRVPNWLVAVGAAAGLALNAWASGGAGVGRSLLGGVVGFCIFLPFFLLRGMGGGDVKLMGALGMCLGVAGIVQTALLASIAGALLAMAVAARHGALGRTFANTGRLLRFWLSHGPRPSEELSLDNPQALKIPYAAPIAVAAVLVVLSGVAAS
jgi:prepilin peptidase CpaA